MCIKYGPAVQLSEAAALRFVAEMTSVPVPKVYSAFQKDRSSYIIMDFIDGEVIGEGWDKRSEAEKASLFAQLKDMFEELHNIPHPRPGVLASSDMQSLYDKRLWKGSHGFGPFANESDFHMFLRCGVHIEDDMIKKETCTWVTDEQKEEMRQMVICFTHGDASSSNVMVKDGKVVALIDFELSGFYPEYWEYTTAMNVNRFDGFWKEEVPKFLKQYPEELQMEELRRKHFGPGGFQGRYPWDILGCV
ncbi:kinase-like protein [Mollisia scopiformis]|uniref:Kinase-like protein n=1 Tax=Mollisia scopiformis TaxID=149040 RepID=A0A194X8Y5_MOLSC|nr:kinase-like protein [Mollisia scopiformis]KUJ16631.1 kinase-like protein [Mollisia scopiformis]